MPKTCNHPDSCENCVPLEMHHSLQESWFKAVDALHKIANMPIEPRPDFTFNYDRAALIYIARKALK